MDERKENSAFRCARWLLLLLCVCVAQLPLAVAAVSLLFSCCVRRAATQAVHAAPQSNASSSSVAPGPPATTTAKAKVTPPWREAPESGVWSADDQADVEMAKVAEMTVRLMEDANMYYIFYRMKIT